MTTYRFDPNAGTPLGTPLGGALSPQAALAELDRLGLGHAGLQLDQQGDHLRLRGQAPDGKAHEQLVLALGNLRGVAAVEDDLVTPTPGLLDSLGGFAHLPAGAMRMQAAHAAMDAHPPEPGTSYGPGGSLFHPVQPGESLAELARRHYGDATEAPRLMAANAPALPPGEPPTGWVLRIPPR